MLTRQFGGWPLPNPIISEKDRAHPLLATHYGQQVDLNQFPWLHTTAPVARNE